MTAISLQELHAQGPFLRRLARALVRDEAAAEDLVQETWVAVLDGLHGPREDEEARGFLARLLRSRARTQRRAELRRRARELAATEGATKAGQTAVAERVLAAVLALDEPYRGLILKRYYQDLSPKEIARLEDTPLKTVEGRLARARRELRARLDGDFGDRATWGVALAVIGGLAVVERPARWAGLGALATAATIAGVTVVVLRFAGLGGSDEAVEVTRIPMGESPSLPTPLVEPRELTMSSDGGRTTSALPQEAVEAVPAEAFAFPVREPEPTARLTGRVIAHPSEDPWVAAFPIDSSDSRTTWRTGEAVMSACAPDGSFELSLPLADGDRSFERMRVIAVARGVKPRSETIEVEPGDEAFLELPLDDPGAVVSGVVVDRSGAPLAHAAVRVTSDAPDEWLAVGPHRVLEAGTAHAARDVVADALGRFEVRGLANWRHRFLVVPASDTADSLVIIASEKAGTVHSPSGAGLTLRPTLDEIVLQVTDGLEPLGGVSLIVGDLDRYEELVWDRANDAAVLGTRLPDNGRVRILLEPRGHHSVVLERPGFEPEPVPLGRLSLARRTVEVALTAVDDPPTLVVDVEALGPDETLVPDFRVRVAPAEGYAARFQEAREVFAAPGSAGPVEARVERLSQGVYDVWVQPSEGSGWLPARAAARVEPEGETRVAVSLRRGARVVAVPAEGVEGTAGQVRLELIPSADEERPTASDGHELRAADPARTQLAAGVPLALGPAVPAGSWSARLWLGEDAVWEGELLLAAGEEHALLVPAPVAAPAPQGADGRADDGSR